MKRYLFPFVTDLHLRHSKPRCRIDENYLSSQLEDLQNAISQQNYEHSYVLCGGDVLNKYDEPPMVMNSLYQFLCDTRKTIITTVGQHDVHNHTISMWRDTSQLRLLEGTGRGIVLTNGEFTRIGEARIIGCGFGQECTEALLNGETIVSNPTAYDIYIIHASIGDGSNKYIRGINTVRLNNPGVYLFGDIHPGFPVTVFPSGAIAVNPGSLAKQSIDNKYQYITATSIYEEDNALGVELTKLYTRQDKFVENVVRNLPSTEQALSVVKQQLSAIERTKPLTPTEYVTQRAESMGIEKDPLNRVLQEVYEQIR